MEITYQLLREIEQIHGDSWYFLDVDKFEGNYQELLNAFREIYPLTEIAYSYKTNYIPDICRIVNKNGGFAEVVSEMEYELAVKLGVDPARIIVNGPYKPERALEIFLNNGSIVNLDSYYEVDMLKVLLKRNADKVYNIGVRCNFEFSGISVSRFGLDVEDGNFFNTIEELRRFDNLRFVSLHCHFPNRDLNLFGERVDKMMSLYRKVYKNGDPLWIDIGGGLGGKLDDFLKKQLNRDIADYKDYAQLIATKFKKEFLNDINKPSLILEPGTALVADTMQFVCKVIEIKKIRNNYIAITSGSKVNFHPMASKIYVPMKVYGDPKSPGPSYDSIDISGYTCMEGDYLFENYSGELKIGDFLVFENVGSYSVVFKPPFILPNVPVVSIKNDQVHIVKNAETFDSIFHTYNIISHVNE
jgi:diaminopimelate decarboxylase